MKYKIINDDEILNLSVRQKIIKEITDTENVARKEEAQKRQEIYKDNTKKWVIAALEKDGLKEETLERMANRTANISICKKIINKLARCYAGGVQRVSTIESDQVKVDEIARVLSLNTKNKKADRFRELQKNVMVQSVPCKDLNASEDAGSDKFNIDYRVYSPWQYDVVEDYYDHEKPRIVILSDFSSPRLATQHTAVDSNGPVGAHVQTGLLGTSRPEGDGRDQLIADNPFDDQSCEFIFWSKKYHLTTDKHGNIIKERSPDQLLNPIQKLPFSNISQDQDGKFWALGGDDLVDGSILINLEITDILFISYTQGYGQLVITGGQDIPDNIDGGPTQAIILRRKDSTDPESKVEYVTANPPLEMHMKAVEQYAALLLSTNGLSPTNVAGALDASQFPSGVALLIENAEATGNIEDKQQLMSEVESDAFETIKLWHNYLFDQGALTDEFAEIGKFADDTEIIVKFNQSKPVITEKEKLEILKARQELGIDTELDTIMGDNPNMDRKDAEKKLLEIKAEQLKKRQSVMGSFQLTNSVDNQPTNANADQGNVA